MALGSFDTGNISQSISKFLSQYLPMLVQQQQQRSNWDYQQDQRKEYSDYSMESYLKRRLAEMDQANEYNIAGDDRAILGNMLQNFFATAQAETKELPYGSQQFAQRTAPAATQLGLDPLPVSPTLGADTERYAQIAQQLALAKVTGQEPSSELIEEAVASFGLDAVVSEVAKYDASMAKSIDQKHRAAELNIKGYEAESGRLSAETSAKTQEGKAGEDALKGWISFVEDIEDHIRMEGVSIPPDDKDLQETFRALAASGKFPDPLSPKTRGAVFSILGGIRGRLIDGTLPTEAEKKFIAEARNTYRIEDRIDAEGNVIKGEGLVDTTKTAEEMEIDEAMILEYMAVIKEFTKNDVPPPTEEQLRALAIERLSELK